MTIKKNTYRSRFQRAFMLPERARLATVLSVGTLAFPLAFAQTSEPSQLQEVVVSAGRKEQLSFDAAAAIAAVPVDSFRTSSPLVNLSELLSAVPGLQIRERQNFAQDLQLSVRGLVPVQPSVYGGYECWLMEFRPPCRTGKARQQPPV